VSPAVIRAQEWNKISAAAYTVAVFRLRSYGLSLCSISFALFTMSGLAMTKILNQIYTSTQDRIIVEDNEDMSSGPPSQRGPQRMPSKQKNYNKFFEIFSNSRPKILYY
jgi:hypothetical protein